jgi:hypothetical protein
MASISPPHMPPPPTFLRRPPSRSKSRLTKRTPFSYSPLMSLSIYREKSQGLLWFVTESSPSTAPFRPNMSYSIELSTRFWMLMFRKSSPLWGLVFSILFHINLSQFGSSLQSHLKMIYFCPVSAMVDSHCRIFKPPSYMFLL